MYEVKLCIKLNETKETNVLYKSDILKTPLILELIQNH